MIVLSEVIVISISANRYEGLYLSIQAIYCFTIPRSMAAPIKP